MSPRAPYPAIDTSAFLALSGLGLLDILPRLWPALAVTFAVRTELTVDHPNDVPDPATLSWVVAERPLPHPAVVAWGKLGKGEASVLSLALHRDDVLAIVDEKRGKKAGLALGLGPRLTGTLGILLRAKAAGLVAAVAPYVQKLEDLEPHFHMGPELMQSVLEQAGEGDAVISLNPRKPRRL